MDTYTAVSEDDLVWACAFLRSHIIHIQNSQRPLTIEYIEGLTLADANDMMLQDMQRRSNGRVYQLEDVVHDTFTKILRTVIHFLSQQDGHQPDADVRTRMLAVIARTQPRRAPPGPHPSVDEDNFAGPRPSAPVVAVLPGPQHTRMHTLLSQLAWLIA